MSPRGERRSRTASRADASTTKTRGGEPRGPSEGSDKPREKCATISVLRNRYTFRRLRDNARFSAIFAGRGSDQARPPGERRGTHSELMKFNQTRESAQARDRRKTNLKNF